MAVEMNPPNSTSPDPLVERQWLTLRADPSAGATVPSPCMNVCRIDAASGWCEGCMRTLDEIADWSGMSTDEKRAVWDQLQQRFDARFDAT